MAKGSQDWIARTDIFLQSLSVLSQRLKLGFSKVYSFYGTVGANTDTQLVSITGSGNVVGCFSWVQDTGQIDNNYYFSVADGGVLGDWPVGWYRNFVGIIIPQGVTAYYTIDDVNFKYEWKLFKPISFDSHFTAYYHEAHGRTPTVRFDVIVGLF